VFGESFREDARQERPSAERDTGEDVGQSIWPDEPALLGVDDGVPSRLDRTKVLGNTIVPKIPELIGRAILASLTTREAAA
jgi:hypothetical protein